MKNTVIPAALTVILMLTNTPAFSSGRAKTTKKESMTELTDRVFRLAATQFKLMDSSLSSGESPKTTDDSGLLVKRDIKWWCSGFFPGSLWYTYEYTGDESIRALAEKHTLQLSERLEQKTDHDIGFQIECSFGNALRITGDTSTYQAAVLKGAEKLAERFNPVAGVTRSWDGKWAAKWDYPVIIDNMMNLEILMHAYRINGNETLYKIATTHANTTLAHHFRTDYSCYHLVNYNSADGSVIGRQTHQGYGDETTWARGEAWALYGFAMMYVKTGDEQYYKQADYISKYIFNNVPEDGIPYWDYSQKGDLRDASAAAIMASAFIRMYEVSGRKHFLDFAEKELRTLASKEYLAEPGTNGGFLLKHSVGNKPANSEVDVPLTYADYYFLEALLRWKRATSHPRLFINEKDFDDLKTQVQNKSNRSLGILHGQIMKEAEAFPSDPIEWKLDASGKRILGQARLCLKLLINDAYAWRFTKDARYARHAEWVIDQMCAMPDWNAWHFLDPAEIAAGAAIAFDWMYDVLKPETKAKLVKATVDNALMEGLDFYKGWFYDRSHNWNQVCNSGLAMAALSMREEIGPLAGNAIHNAVKSIRLQMPKVYAPDGCYPEGPNYWVYGNTYQMLMNSSFDSAIGDDFGLSSIKGFSETGDFVTSCYGAAGKMFNYYDNSAKESPSIPLWYFAWRFNKPYLLSRELQFLDGNDGYYNKDCKILPVIAGFAAKIKLDSVGTSPNKLYFGRGSNPIVTMRGDGSSTDTDWFLGIKGGTASNNHGHADAGSFVFDRDGVRWASDPGAPIYTKAENEIRAKGGDLWERGQNSLRWTIFPLGNEWHNTLTVNGKRHIVDAKSAITDVHDYGETKTATVNLQSVLGKDIETAKRKFEIIDGRKLVITDNIKASADSRIRFTLVTEATPCIDGNSLKLTYGEKAMEVTTSGAEATISIFESSEAANKGLHIVRIEYDIKSGDSCCFRTLMN